MVDNSDQRWLCDVDFDDSEMSISWNTNNDEIVLYHVNDVVKKLLPGEEYVDTITIGGHEYHISIKWWKLD